MVGAFVVLMFNINSVWAVAGGLGDCHQSRSVCLDNNRLGGVLKHSHTDEYRLTVPFKEKDCHQCRHRVTIKYTGKMLVERQKVMNSVADWVAKNAAAAEDPYSKNDYSRKVTVRLDLCPYATLALLAQRFGFTPTKCAEELLKAAINEAYKASGVNEAELQEFVEAEL